MRALLLLFLLAPFAAHAQVSPSLVAADASVQPGRSVRLAVRLEHQPGWHTYWVNAGIGMATKLTWDLPANWKPGAIEWPTPTIIRGKEGNITGHGYEGVAYLPVTLTPPRDAKTGEDAVISVDASWLMCTVEICIPGEGRAELSLPVFAEVPKPNAAVTAELAKLPMPHPPKGWKVSASRDARLITLKVSETALRSPHFFGEEEEYIQFDAPQTMREEGGGHTFLLRISEDAPTQPTRLVGVLAYNDASGTYRGLRVDVPFTTARVAGTADAPAVPPASNAANGPTSGPSAPTGVGSPQSGGSAASTPSSGTAARRDDSSAQSSVASAPAAGAAPRGGQTDAAANASSGAAHLPSLDPSETQASFIATLLLGVLGGLILNLMPCVFPVLGIKVLGFVNQAGTDRAKITRHGLVFTLGVLVSFWALAVLLGLLRAGGAGLGWGFQLQSAAFVFVLTVVMLIFGLNLSGVFEFGLRATGVGGDMQMKSGYFGSFFSGVLATVVATPCSAPFLAPALGAALTLPLVESLIVFTAIGIGLAAPYLVLSMFPTAVKLLPKPGRWMETFKQAMAFPLYATAGYLIWILAGQTSESALLTALLGLVAVAMGCWIFGRYTAPGASVGRMRFGLVGGLALLALGTHLGWPRLAAATDIVWEPWSVERVEQLRAEGRTIYVDFTARWCATCQANKRVVFGSDEVKRSFARRNVATLKADWTNQDARITAELARWGRSAIPFNLIYLPGQPQPEVLPELLTPGIVLNAIEE